MTPQEKAFIAEIERNHTTDSIQYVWAVNTCKEAAYKWLKKQRSK